MRQQATSHTLRATSEEQARRDSVIARAIDFIRRGQKIKLPPFGPEAAGVTPAIPANAFALQTIRDNDFSGSIGPFRYQLEGEDDLLHLIVVRADRMSLRPEEGRGVAGFVFAGVSPSVIWLKPGEFSEHFYLGHDELLGKTAIDQVNGPLVLEGPRFFRP